MTAIPNLVSGEKSDCFPDGEPQLKIHKGGAVFIRPSENPYTPVQYASDPFVHGVRLYPGYRTENIYDIDPKTGLKKKTASGTRRVDIPATHPAEIIVFLLRNSKIISLDHTATTRQILEDFYCEFEEFITENGEEFAEEYLCEETKRYEDAAIIAEMENFQEGTVEYHAHLAKDLLPFLKHSGLFARYMIAREQSAIE